MNLASYLATPVTTLDQWYATTVDKRERFSPCAASEVRRREKKDSKILERLVDKVSYYRTLTDQQFQSIHFRNALNLTPAGAARLCSQLVKFEFATLVGRTGGTRRKPANIYEWLPTNL